MRQVNKLQLVNNNTIADNIDKIKELFPHCVSEALVNGKLTQAIDLKKLLIELGIEDNSESIERYEFTWPNKRDALRKANEPTTNTLRPCIADSINFEHTRNLYLEGDNLEVLKCIKKSYLNKVKMIYIDPPYNTGNDFVYQDAFTQDQDRYLQESAQVDELGNRLVANKETNGRFHTDWLNMIYPRLKVARDLLTSDGVIFISIDDNEQKNLRNVCDEIFGATNFVAQLIWERAFSPKNDAKYVSNSHDYVLMYARNINDFVIGRTERTEEANARYSNPDNDPRGVWTSSDITVKTYSAAYDYPITTPSGREVNPPKGRCWCLSKEEFANRVADNRIWFGADGNNTPRIKRFLSELKFEGMAPTSILFHKKLYSEQEQVQELIELFNSIYNDGIQAASALLERMSALNKTKAGSSIVNKFLDEVAAQYSEPQSFLLREAVGDSQDGTRNLKALFDNSMVFDGPKPVQLIKHLMTLANLQDDSIVLDFFSGSATTAHAMFEYNEHNRKHCSFILIQIPEVITSDKVDTKFDNICTIAKERIKRAGIQVSKLLAERQASAQEQEESSMPLFSTATESLVEPKHFTLDVGFRVLKLDSSNMEEVFYSPDKLSQQSLLLAVDPIKSDRSDEDLLFQVMLDLGLDLTSPILTVDLEQGRAFKVMTEFDDINPFMIFYCGAELDITTFTQLLKLQPSYLVLKDSDITSDSLITNYKHLLTTYSPDTTINII